MNGALTLLLAMLLFAGALAAMAIGVIISNKPLKGSCGGIGALGLARDCELCGARSGHCQQQRSAAAGSVPTAPGAGKKARSDPAGRR